MSSDKLKMQENLFLVFYVLGLGGFGADWEDGFAGDYGEPVCSSRKTRKMAS